MATIEKNIKIRFQGTEEEIMQIIDDLEHIYEIRDVSRFYANNRYGKSKEGRVYVTLAFQAVDCS